MREPSDDDNPYMRRALENDGAIGRLNLRALDAFRLTMEHGSASAAARLLGVTQPAVSRLLAILEEEVGFELFAREKGRLVATVEAQLLAREVGQVLGRLDQIAMLARNLGEGTAGTLRIASPPSLIDGPLAHVLADFMRKHPQLRVSVWPRDARMVEEMVATRAVDCGFTRLPLERSDVRATVLTTNETVCVLPPRHRLAKLETIGPTDLAGVPLIMLLPGRPSRLAVDAAFERVGVRPHVQLATQTIGSACAFAAKGVGIAIVNGLMAPVYLRKGMQLRRFRPRVLHQYGFVTPRDAPLTKVTEVFHEHCRREFAAFSDRAVPGASA
jgi:DNA-binding transcriptional LysR family regulator